MRKIAILFAANILNAPAVYAQEDSTLYNLLTQQREYECLDIVANANAMIPGFYDHGKIDSIYTIINYVEAKCGGGLFPNLRVLLAIESNSFTTDWCDSAIVDEIVRSSMFICNRSSCCKTNRLGWMVREIDDNYYFISRIASRLF